MNNVNVIKSSDDEKIKSVLNTLYIPPEDSHKGQNGKVLIIGGSSLFHASPLWAAQIATHYCDMVHFASTKENNEIFQTLKTQFRDGMIVPQEEVDGYAKEDDAVLIGPGMMRGEGEEAVYSKEITHHLLDLYPDKKFVLDAGALQMMNKDWLLKMNETPIVTPHQKEFEQLFGISLENKTVEEKVELVKKTAQENHSVILLKAVVDIISDGKTTYMIEGGNAGLTKGGSGDILAGLVTSLAAKNKSLVAAVASSLLLKRTADELFLRDGYWYNMTVLIQNIPSIFKKILYN